MIVGQKIITSVLLSREKEPEVNWQDRHAGRSGMPEGEAAFLEHAECPAASVETGSLRSWKIALDMW